MEKDMTREEKKLRLVCNNLTHDEVKTCSSILKLAKDASLTPDEVIDVLKAQGILKFKEE